METKLIVNPVIDEKCLLFWYDLYCIKLSQTVFANDKSITEKFLLLRAKFARIASYAGEYDLEHVKGNGYWSLLKLVNKLLEFTYYNHTKSEYMKTDFEPVLEVMLNLFQMCEDIRECSLSDSRRPLLVTEDSLALKLVDLLFDSEKAITANRSYGCFYLSPESRLVGKHLMMALSYHAATFWDTLKWTLSPGTRWRALLKVLKTKNAITMRKIIRVTETQLISKVVPNLFYGLKPSRCETFFFDLETKWKISVSQDGKKNTIKLNDQINGSNRMIRCRFLLETKSGHPPSDCLHFHCHGGGFIGQSPEAHETYLREWAIKVSNVPILSVDYSLSPEAKFPTAVQQVLDVYLWATSGDSLATATMGFCPQRVILSGDSAGANLVSALCLVLNDIRRMKEPPIILMPKALFLIYPFNSVSLNICPSFLISFFCPIISPFSIYNVIEAYLPNADTHRKERNDNAGNSWFLRSSERDAFVQYLDGWRLNPYVSPVCYQHFDTLKDVSLYIFQPVYCPLLDHNVEFAKQWEGPVSFDMLDNLGHGCFCFTLIDEEANRANKFFIAKLTQAINKL